MMTERCHDILPLLDKAATFITAANRVALLVLLKMPLDKYGDRSFIQHV